MPTQATIVESLPREVDVDRATGVIKGVKLVGLNSKNGRKYSESALRTAVGLYEGSRINVDHKVGGRTVSERIGSARSVRFVEGQGIFGDAHLNPAHSQFSQIAWEAEQAKAGHSSGIGFSHVAECSIDRAGTTVTEIHQVRHVDIVADPATTQSFFESQGDRMDLSQVTLEQLRKENPALVESIEKPHKDALVAEQAKVKGLEDKAARSALEESVRKEMKDLGLDASNEKQVPKFFFEQCLSAKPEDRKTYIEDRAALLKATPGPKVETPTTTSESTDPPAEQTLSEQDVNSWLNRMSRN